MRPAHFVARHQPCQSRVAIGDDQPQLCPSGQPGVARYFMGEPVGKKGVAVPRPSERAKADVDHQRRHIGAIGQPQSLGQNPAQALHQIGLHPSPGRFAHRGRGQLHGKDRHLGQRISRPRRGPGSKIQHMRAMRRAPIGQGAVRDRKKRAVHLGIDLGFIATSGKMGVNLGPAQHPAADHIALCGRRSTGKPFMGLQPDRFDPAMPPIAAKPGVQKADPVINDGRYRHRRVKVTGQGAKVLSRIRLQCRRYGHGWPDLQKPPEGGQVGQRCARAEGNGPHLMRPPQRGLGAFGGKQIPLMRAEPRPGQRKRGVNRLRQGHRAARWLLQGQEHRHMIAPAVALGCVHGRLPSGIAAMAKPCAHLFPRCHRPALLP